LGILPERAARLRAGHWMQTYTGRAYWPCEPRVEDVCIEDIAHHLSMICRYTGACSRFYSVAEHSVIVSLMVPPQDALCGLLHDATEAYISDVNRPVKRGPGMEGYRAIEKLNWAVIADHFGLPYEMPHSVEQADAEMLYHEQAALLGPSPRRDWGMGQPKPAAVRADLVKGWTPMEAKAVFLSRFEELR
jgi:hypothetical protein